MHLTIIYYILFRGYSDSEQRTVHAPRKYIDESSICGSVKIEPRQRIHSLTADKKQRQVVISRSAANGIISYSKALHPNEGILILQGKTTKEQIIIDSLVIPPFASSGPYYSGYSNFYLPSDSSYVGSAHSHPGGSNRPSLEDLNRGFYGAVSIIIAHPYDDRTIAAYDRNGNKLEIKITNSS